MCCLVAEEVLSNIDTAGLVMLMTSFMQVNLLQVRDRATLYLSQLGRGGGGGGGSQEALQPQWDVPSKNLEASLRAYLQNGNQQAFDLVRPLLCAVSVTLKTACLLFCELCYSCSLPGVQCWERSSALKLRSTSILQTGSADLYASKHPGDEAFLALHRADTLRRLANSQRPVIRHCCDV